MNEYKKYLLRQLGLKEAQVKPSNVDSKELEASAKKEKKEHPQLSKSDAELIAKQHLQKEGMLSPTAKRTPVVMLAIRGSTTGGLPSGADQCGDISPSKVGGYEKVSVEPLNSKLVDKTPQNPQINSSTPITNNPQTVGAVTHPYQVQRDAGEPPQSVTGASVEDSPLTLKSAAPKGLDIQIPEKKEQDQLNEKKKNKWDKFCYHCRHMKPCECDKADDEERELRDKDPEKHKKLFGMKIDKKDGIDETFKRHTLLMKEYLGINEGEDEDDKTCSHCGGSGEVHHKRFGTPSCPSETSKCPECGGSGKVEECKTCGCGDPKDTHGAKGYGWGAKPLKVNESEDEDEERVNICSACDGSGEGRADGTKCQTCGGSGDSKHHWGNRRKERDPDDERDDRREREYMRKHGVDEGKEHSADCMCKKCKEPDYDDYKKKHGEFKGVPKSDLDKDDKIPFKKGSVNESYSPPFARMRGLAGIGDSILMSNGIWENKSPESDAMKQSQAVDKRFAKMEKDPTDRPFPFDKDHPELAPKAKMSYGAKHVAENAGANEPFVTTWKADKEKAGMVKTGTKDAPVNEEKWMQDVSKNAEQKGTKGALRKDLGVPEDQKIPTEKLESLKASLHKKAEEGTLTDKESLLSKRVNAALNMRQSQK